MSIRVVIADDHTVTREGIRSILDQDVGITVEGIAGNGCEAVRLTCELKPHIVIMDISMPDLNGVEATRQILARCPEVSVIALTMYKSHRYLAEMARAGAAGYLLKDGPPKEVIDAIYAVSNRRTYVSRVFGDIRLEDFRLANAEPSSVKRRKLTHRESEVMRCLATGGSNHASAKALGMSVKTFETYRQNIMNKLELSGIADLTRYAIREGIVCAEKVQLTSREREVVQLVAEGKSTAEIADHLHVSTNTVTSHRLHIMRKLQVHSIAELTLYAVKEGLTALQ